jgi:hypothetical protein
MGIEFTEIRDEDKLALEALLHRLDGDASMPLEITSVEGRAATPDLLMIMDPAAALNALAKFFQHNWSLTRTQFAELIGRSQEPDRGERF